MSGSTAAPALRLQARTQRWLRWPRTTAQPAPALTLSSAKRGQSMLSRSTTRQASCSATDTTDCPVVIPSKLSKITPWQALLDVKWYNFPHVPHADDAP